MNVRLYAFKTAESKRNKIEMYIKIYKARKIINRNISEITINLHNHDFDVCAKQK